MKNEKKVITDWVIVLSLFVYQTFIKKQLHFKKKYDSREWRKINPNILVIERGSVKDVMSKNDKKAEKHVLTYT